MLGGGARSPLGAKSPVGPILFSPLHVIVLDVRMCRHAAHGRRIVHGIFLAGGVGHQLDRKARKSDCKYISKRCDVISRIFESFTATIRIRRVDVTKSVVLSAQVVAAVAKKHSSENLEDRGKNAWNYLEYFV